MSEERKIQETEINLIELVKTIWAGRKFVFKITGVFVILGLVIAFTSPIEYVASCKLLPESQEGSMPNLGGLGGLAGLAGLNMGSMTQAGVLSPQLYPEIVNSLPFILKIMNDTIYFENQDLRTTSFDYFENVLSPSIFGYIIKYTFGLPSLIKEAIVGDEDLDRVDDQNKEYYRLSKKQWEIIEMFKQRISLSIDDEIGLISIMVEMPDAYAAAQITKKIEKEITEAIIDYRTNKSNENLKFISKTFEDAKKEFEAIQLRLATASDGNINFSTATAKIELKRLETDYNVAFEVYKGLASQVEQAKITLKEETPVFTVLDPVRVPEDKSKPERGLILVILTFLGGVSGVGVLLIKKEKSSIVI